ncbi:MAG: hypothetical protein U0791_21300 [Gemmataceae bacterium]
MSRIAVAAFTLLFATLPVLADDPAPKDIVAKALKAAGRADDGKETTANFKDSGIVEVSGLKIEYTAEFWFRPPDALRFEMKAEVMNQKIEIKHVTAGDKVIESMGGDAAEVKGDKKDASIAQVYSFWVATLKPLNHDKGFKLSNVVGKKVNDKETHGVLVERKGKAEVTLYFDKASGLLVKSETQVKDEFSGWKEVLEESFYEDYKDAGGVKEATKLRVLRDGKPLISSNPTDYKSIEKPDPKLFEKP